MLQTFGLLVKIVLLVGVVVLLQLFDTRIVSFYCLPVQDWLVHVYVSAAKSPANFTVEVGKLDLKRQRCIWLFTAAFIKTLALTDHSRIEALKWPESELT